MCYLCRKAARCLLWYRDSGAAVDGLAAQNRLSRLVREDLQRNTSAVDPDTLDFYTCCHILEPQPCDPTIAGLEYIPIHISGVSTPEWIPMVYPAKIALLKQVHPFILTLSAAISSALMESMLTLARTFFDLPPIARPKYVPHPCNRRRAARAQAHEDSARTSLAATSVPLAKMTKRDEPNSQRRRGKGGLGEVVPASTEWSDGLRTPHQV